MDEQKIIYYKDELNDEFSEAKIEPILIDEKYEYDTKNPLKKFGAFMFQHVLTVPFKFLYAKFKLKIKYVGKEKLKAYKNTGYFVYANHTQPFADTFIPSNIVFGKRNFFIVNPENVSMKGLKTLVPMLGAIPVPGTKGAMKNFLDVITKRIKQKHSITIYPEAHIWPYYTKIRPFRAVSFKYPIKLKTPVFCITNTYQKYKNGFRLVSYVDGPFFADEEFDESMGNAKLKKRAQGLRDKVYYCMVERSKNSNIEIIKYIKVNDTEMGNKND